MTKKKRSDNIKRSKQDMKRIITRPAGIQAAEFLINETLRMSSNPFFPLQPRENLPAGISGSQAQVEE